MQNSNKGQALSIDILVGTTIFLIVLTVTITIWNNQNVIMQSRLIEQELERTGARSLDYLVKGTGETPNGDTNWENQTSLADVRYIGLAVNDRQADKNKLAKFVEYGKIWKNCTNCFNSYNSTRGKILLTGDMNFYFRFYYTTYSENSALQETIITETARNPTNSLPEETEMTAGIAPGETAKKIIALRRVVFYEGTKYSGPAIAELRVYN